MANTFKIPLLNPFRFVNPNTTFDARYNSKPFDYQIDQYNYFQKWQTNDLVTVQVLSDFVPTFKFYTCDDVLYRTVTFVAVDTEIIGETYKIYEAVVNFSDFAENVYYGVISYTDENSTVQYFQTSPLDLRVLWPKTILYEYRNTFNDKGVVFNSGADGEDEVWFNIRIEGGLREFQPSSEDEEYTDQYYNGILLSSIPYRIFTNYIGLGRLLPDWIIDKMNLVFSVNQVKINGIYFTKADGAKFEMTRAANSEREDAYAGIKVIENSNFDFDQYKTGINPSDELVVIKKQKTFKDVGASFAASGLFNDSCNLVRLAVWNYGLDTFTLKVGTSANSNDIAEFSITGDLTNSLDIGHVFNSIASVYITVPDGVNLKVTFDYNKYDAPILNESGSGDDATFQENVLYDYWETTPGDFDTHWNASTGLGRVNTRFEGCALMDGRNGTVNLAYMFTQGWDKDYPALRQTITGNANNQVEIAKTNLPDTTLKLFTDDVSTTDPGGFTDESGVAISRNLPGQDRNYVMIRGAIGKEATIGNTSKLGDGAPLEITPESIIIAKFIKLP